MKTSHKLLGALTGVATLLSAAPALAVSVVNAARVEISSAIPDWLQIAEVEAFEWGTLVNVAAAANGGVATAISTGYGGFPPGAIDGVIPGGYVGAFVYHSATHGAGEMLTITFAQATDLASLKVYGVMDGGAPRNFFNYSIYDARDVLLASGQLDSRITAPGVATFDAPPVTGGVPEPSTWAMLILGFGAAGAAIRSRRQARAIS